MIEYTNISFEEYSNLSDKEKKENSYCIEYDSISQIFIINDKLHREDGPAEIFEGNFYWFLNGNQYSFEEWCNKLNKSDEEKVFLRLKYL